MDMLESCQASSRARTSAPSQVLGASDCLSTPSAASSSTRLPAGSTALPSRHLAMLLHSLPTTAASLSCTHLHRSSHLKQSSQYPLSFFHSPTSSGSARARLSVRAMTAEFIDSLALRLDGSFLVHLRRQGLAQELVQLGKRAR